MSNSLYQQLEEHITALFSGENGGTPHPLMVKHLKRAAYWVKVLRPDADEAFLLAAVGHDIERAYKDKRPHGITEAEQNGTTLTDPVYLKFHQGEGARILGEWLQEHGADSKLIERVKHLVETHEVGGDEDQNLIQDVDSMSFFENNIDHFIKHFVKERGVDAVRTKFNWMWERMHSAKAKEIVRPWYEAAIQKLGQTTQ